MGIEVQSHACAVCGRVLDWHEDIEAFQHALVDVPADHPAIPVRVEDMPDQLLPRCDFCLEGIPTHTLPARSFHLSEAVGCGSVGNWAACLECAEAIQQDRWNALTRRALAAHERRHGELPPMIEPALRKMYRDLRKNVTGAIRPYSSTTDS